MAGYFKFSLIIAIGAFLFDDPISFQQILSIISVMGGLILYSYFKIQETKKAEIKPANDAEKGEVEAK